MYVIFHCLFGRLHTSSTALIEMKHKRHHFLKYSNKLTLAMCEPTVLEMEQM
jgi:hypothetical protein